MYLDSHSSNALVDTTWSRTASLSTASTEAITSATVDSDYRASARDGSPSESPIAAGDRAEPADRTGHPVGFIEDAALTFEILRAEARDESERAFVDGLVRLRRDGTPIRFSAKGPSMEAVVGHVGVAPADEAAAERFASILAKVAHLLVPAGGRGSGREARRGRADTFLGTVKMKLDDLPHGTRVPRWLNSDSRASTPGIAKMLGLPLAAYTRSPQARAEVTARLADGRLVLGEPYRESAGWLKQLRTARAKVIASLDRRAHEVPVRPVLIDALGRRAVLMDPILDEAGIVDAREREAMKCDQKVRTRLARLTAVVGARCAAIEVGEDRPILTFDELMEKGAADAAEAFRNRNPAATDAAAEKAGKDEGSFLRRAMKVNGWSGTQDVRGRLSGDGAAAAIDLGRSGNVRSDRNYVASMDRWTKIAAAVSAARSSDETFGERVGAGIRRLGLSAKDYCASRDMPYDAVARWRRGEAIPNASQLNFVHVMEADFGLARGELVDMLGIVRPGRNRSKRVTIRLEDGRTVKLAKYLRFLSADALNWSDERLRLAVADVEVRHFGSKTINTVRQRAVHRLSAERKPLDRSAPIFSEWAALQRFKTRMCDATRHLNPKWEWRSSATIAKNRAHAFDFARWCAMPIEEGGLGLPASQISFILFLNVQVVAKYVFHRVLRFSHLTIDGRELGPMLGGTEFGFLGFVKQLLDVESGWLTQSPHEVKSPEVIDVKFPLEEMYAIDNRFVVEMPERPEICTVMDAELVRRIETNWVEQVLVARRFASSLNGKVARQYKMIRDPQKLVGPILKHAYPLAVVIRQVKEALSKACPIEVSPMDHARDYRNAVAMLLLCTVVFRSSTLRNMTWRADGTGELVRTANGYDVIVGSDRFKNGQCSWLFGPSYRRRDYERALGDWGSLTNILDYYLKTCRPILMRGGKTDLLFPTGQGAERWTHNVFNAMITNWTRTWSVRNERHGTGMDGVLPWGPHAARDIAATHIILHFPGEQRWELAAKILATGIEVVRKHYAYVDARRELAKADGIYEEAFRLGFGEKDISNFDVAG